jgi:RNA-directed DNA polymerase
LRREKYHLPQKVDHTPTGQVTLAEIEYGRQDVRCTAALHDPVPNTGQWLRSVVQGYFNYYAVPGNNASLSLFRHRVLVCWWHSIRRRSQKRRINWTRMLDLAKRWLPQPAVLHPFPDARFAAIHPR